VLTLHDPAGALIAKVKTQSLGGGFYGVVLTWESEPHDLSSPETALAEFQRLIGQARAGGAQTLQSRVVTIQSGVDPALVTARARWHRSILIGSGFTQGSGRIEFQTPLEQAIGACAEAAPFPGLTWEPIASDPGLAMERAARVMQATAVGDPDSDPQDDAAAFLLARRGEKDLLLTPDCIQLGHLHEQGVAIVAPSFKPATGWCSLYYLGVVPAHRGRGLGLAAMRHGLQVLHRLGGRMYHDGTGSENLAALALFRRMGGEPFRSMEQWSVSF